LILNKKKIHELNVESLIRYNKFIFNKNFIQLINNFQKYSGNNFYDFELFIVSNTNSARKNKNEEHSAQSLHSGEKLYNSGAQFRRNHSIKIYFLH
jgi:hypothetical protein